MAKTRSLKSLADPAWALASVAMAFWLLSLGCFGFVVWLSMVLLYPGKGLSRTSLWEFAIVIAVLVAVPAGSWLAAGLSTDSVARRLQLAETLVMAGIGMAALTAISLATSVVGLGVVYAAASIAALSPGITYRRRHRAPFLGN